MNAKTMQTSSLKSNLNKLNNANISIDTVKKIAGLKDDLAYLQLQLKSESNSNITIANINNNRKIRILINQLIDKYNAILNPLNYKNIKILELTAEAYLKSEVYLNSYYLYNTCTLN